MMRNPERDPFIPDTPEDEAWFGGPRLIANVRAAGVAVRATLFVAGIVVALLAVVGVAYLWGD